MDETNGNGSQSVDLTPVNDKLDDILKALSKDNKAIIRDCAITLYTYTNFDTNKSSTVQIAKDCIAKALIIADELQKVKLLDD